MAAPDSFIDTNILIYAISTEPSEAAKSAVARRLLSTANWAWSAQVAAEFINASTSARRPIRLTLTDAEQWIDLWLAFPLVAIETSIVKDAIRLARQYQISYFDAQIIAAARRLGCGTLYTEDLNHGQVYDGVAVMNPFLGATP
ncbi:MAG: PIN domain-containing protein [Pirellulaceae bacterium]